MTRGTTYAEELASLAATGEWDPTPYLGRFVLDPESESRSEYIKVEDGLVTVKYFQGIPGEPPFYEMATIPLIDEREPEEDDEDPRDGDPKYWIELRAEQAERGLD